MSHISQFQKNTFKFLPLKGALKALRTTYVRSSTVGGKKIGTQISGIAYFNTLSKQTPLVFDRALKPMIYKYIYIYLFEKQETTKLKAENFLNLTYRVNCFISRNTQVLQYTFSESFHKTDRKSSERELRFY